MKKKIYNIKIIIEYSSSLFGFFLIIKLSENVLPPIIFPMLALLSVLVLIIVTKYNKPPKMRLVLLII
jgi:hypothetical protein